MGEDDRSLGVGENEAEALAGRIGIERDVSAAGLEHGEEGDKEGGGAFEAKGDKGLGADAEGAEVMGEAVGLGVEFAVGEVLLFESQRDGLRRGAGVRLEERVDAVLRRKGTRRRAGLRRRRCLTHAGRERGTERGFHKFKFRRKSIALASFDLRLAPDMSIAHLPGKYLLALAPRAWRGGCIAGAS